MNLKILQHRLNQIFTRFKDNMAVEYGTKTKTYRQLDNTTTAVANYLKQENVKKETFIGVLLEDRLDLICSIIGILKAGCVFVPLDPDYPDHRLQSMINTTNLQYIISDEINTKRFENNGRNSGQNLEFLPIRLLKKNEYNPPGINWGDGLYSPDDKIYIYFTSGSTGTPKAIVGRNKSLLHFIDWEIQEFGIDDTFRTSQFTNPGFDVFLRDVFIPFCAGGTLCIPAEKEKAISRERTVHWLDHQRINLMHIVPSLFRVFNTPHLSRKNFSHLKYVLFAGEKVIPNELDNWYDIFSDRIQLVNLYGPTETTLAKAYYRIQPGDTTREVMPIGQNIRGARLIILDENMNLCEKLEKGELYVRTPYRSFGYYNDPPMNREKFLPNLFNNDPEDIIYKTGDLARYLADGNIELCGRIDRQVKIRGMRVQLEGIENTLIKHPLVNEAVVVKREITGVNEFLAAFITCPDHGDNDGTGDHQALAADLKEYLGEELPEHMIPSHIKVIGEIPRKINGKIDYDGTAELMKYHQQNLVPPGNHIEKRLLDIWSLVLGIREIGVNQSFFDLGGNSLNVMSMISHIHKEFDVRISLGDIFKNPSIRMQGEILIQMFKDRFIAIEPVEKKEYYQLSPAQRRMYFLQQMEVKSTFYNMTVNPVFIDGATDRQRLEMTFEKLIRRHEAFRTSFLIIDQQPVQKVYRDVHFDISYFYGHADQQPHHRLVETVLNDFIRPFELEQAPLIRVGVISTGEDTHCLLVDIHHIITDGTSLSLLIEDFTHIYNREELPPLKLQYKDFAEWQNSEVVKHSLKQQEEYWLTEFKDEIPILKLPTDYPRPEQQSFDGDMVHFIIGSKETAGLEQLAHQEKATLFIVLLSLYNVWTYRITNQRDIVIGTSMAGRRHAHLEDIIGVFLNIIPLRNYPDPEKTFIGLLREVKERTLQALENQDYPLEELVSKLAVERQLDRNQLFNLMIHSGNIPVKKGFLPESLPEPEDTEAQQNNRYDFERYRTPADFEINFTTIGDKIGVKFVYIKKLFKRETIERWVNYFQEILSAVINNQDIKLKDIQISHGLNEVVSKNPEISFDF